MEEITPTSNGWNQWEKLIVYRLDTLTEGIEELKRLSSTLTTGHIKLSEDLVALKIKSGMWGAISGGIATALGAFGMYLTNK